MTRVPRRRFLRVTGAGVAGSTMGVPVAADDLEDDDDEPSDGDEPDGPEPQDVIEADWTMWRFNRANTGRNPHSFGGTEFPDLWEYDEGSSTLYSPAIADGIVYWGDRDDAVLYAVDADTGEEIWTASAGGIIQSTPTILEGVVYAAAYDGKIYAWDAETGEEIWNVVGGGTGERTSSVTVSSDEETIFVGSDDAVYSLVPESGDINWEFSTSDNLTGSPSVAGGVVYQGDWSGNLYAIDAETGEEVWSRQLGNDVRSTAAIVDGVLYLGVFSGSNTSTTDDLSESDGPPRDDSDPSPTNMSASSGQPTGVYALDADDGEILWEYEMDTVFSSPAVAEGLVFANDYSGTFVALDQETGEEVWSHNIDGSANPTTSPAYANGVVYSGSGSSESSLFVFDAETGEVLEKLDVDAGEVNSPAVTEDAVYVTAEGSFSASLHGYTIEVEERGVTGTVTGPDGEPVAGAELSLFAPTQEGVATDEILDAYPDHPDPESELDVLASGTTDADGSFSLLGVDPRDYSLLVLPEVTSDYEPVIARNIIVSDGTTERDIQLAENRPLAELDDVMRELVGESNTSGGAVATRSSVSHSRGLVGDHLETTTEQTAQVTVDAIDEAPDAEDLVSVFDVTDDALDYDLDAPRSEFEEDLKEDLAESGLDLAERGLNRTLDIIWDQLDEDTQDALMSVTADIGFFDSDLPSRDLEWLINQGYTQSSLYNGAVSDIDLARNQYDVVATQEPEPGFSTSAAKEILEDVRRQVQNPDEWGVPGYVALPEPEPGVRDGVLLEIDQAETYEAAFRGTQDQVQNFEDAGTVALAGKVAGGALVLTGKGAPVGAKVMKLSAKAYKASEFAATIAKIKLMLEAVLTTVHWGLDTSETASVSTETVEWLEAATNNPDLLPEFKIVDVDLNLEQSSIPLVPDYVSANQPPPEQVPDFLKDTDFSPIDRVGVQTKAVYDAEITIENITDATKQFEVTMYNQYDEGEAVSNEAPKYPDEGEVATLEPGDQTTVELEYVSDFRELSDILNVYTMVIQVWSDGMRCDDKEITYQVRPGIGLESAGGATPMRSPRFAMTRAGKGYDTPITAAELDQLRPRVETTLTGTVDPDEEIEEIEITADEDTDRLAFLLTTTGSVALQVFDEQGRQVGYEPGSDEVLTQIPDSRYVGPEATPQIVAFDAEPGRSYTVRAVGYRFISLQEHEVTIHKIDTPKREALLSVSPDDATTVISPGEERTTQVYLSEVGEQFDIEDATLFVTDLTDGGGNELDNVEIISPVDGFDVPAGEIAAADIDFDASAEVPTPNAPEDTRFEGNIAVETTNAGSLEVSLSVLVLATELENIFIRGASPSVEGVEVSATTLEDVEPEPPSGVEPLAAYEVQTTGSGDISFGFPRPETASRPAVFAVGEAWKELDVGFTEGQVRFAKTVEDPDTVVVANIVPSVADYTNEDDIVGTDGAREAIDDWASDQIDTDLLSDIIDAWESGSPIT